VWDLNWLNQVQSNLRQGLKRAHHFRLPALDPALAPPSHISLKSVTTCAFAVGLSPEGATYLRCAFGAAKLLNPGDCKRLLSRIQ
jgi:hypothetical protein